MTVHVKFVVDAEGADTGGAGSNAPAAPRTRPRLCGTRVHAAALGDHLALAVDIELDVARRTDQHRTTSLWKVDPSIAADPAFMPAFSARWQRWRQQRGGKDILAWWEDTKGKMQGATVRPPRGQPPTPPAEFKFKPAAWSLRQPHSLL